MARLNNQSVILGMVNAIGLPHQKAVLNGFFMNNHRNHVVFHRGIILLDYDTGIILSHYECGDIRLLSLLECGR